MQLHREDAAADAAKAASPHPAAPDQTPPMAEIPPGVAARPKPTGSPPPPPFPPFAVPPATPRQSYNPGATPPAGSRPRGRTPLGRYGGANNRYATSLGDRDAKACRIALARTIAHGAVFTDHVAQTTLDFCLPLRAFLGWVRVDSVRGVLGLARAEGILALS